MYESKVTKDLKLQKENYLKMPKTARMNGLIKNTEILIEIESTRDLITDFRLRNGYDPANMREFVERINYLIKQLNELKIPLPAHH